MENKRVSDMMHHFTEIVNSTEETGHFVSAVYLAEQIIEETGFEEYCRWCTSFRLLSDGSDDEA